jgi:HEAT repeat protein
LKAEDFDPDGVPDSLMGLRETHAFAKAQRAARQDAGDAHEASELERILRALDGTDAVERARAVHALGERGEELVVELLERRLHDASEHVRFHAREALATFNQRRDRSGATESR